MNEYRKIFKYMFTLLSKIPFLKRTVINNTHSNTVDDNISEITVWEINQRKNRFAKVLYILSFGIVYILTLYYPKLYIYLICDPCEILSAEYCLITNKEGEDTLCKIKSCRFQETIHKGDIIKSHYVGPEILNKHDNQVTINFMINIDI